MVPELFNDFQDPTAIEICNNLFNNITVKRELCINLGCQSVQYIKEDDSKHSACETGGKYTFTW